MLKFFLFLFSLIYGLIIWALMSFYSIRPYRTTCKVISVGNISLGGTGKTPLVEYVVRWLKQHNHKVAVLTRGYLSFDEPQMLRENLKDIPVIVGRDRVAGIRRAVSEYGADTVVLDDGFQQWRIKKDLDIVAVNSRDPFGNRKMIPRGILRQPLSSLDSAGIFVLTKADINPDLKGVEDYLLCINPKAVIAQALYKTMGFYELGKKDILLDPGTLKDKAVALVCGIADPASFKYSVESLGIKIGITFDFPDHHNYSAQDLDNIIKASKEKGIGTIITTEKDAVKLDRLPVTGYRLPIFVLRIELQITKNEEGFLERLSKLYVI